MSTSLTAPVSAPVADAPEDATVRKTKLKDAVVDAIKAKKQAEVSAAKSQHAKELVQASVTLAATASKQAAIDACIAKVDAIVEECYANNTRFRDSTFDLLNDKASCLVSSATSSGLPWFMFMVDGAKRVSDLVKNPLFFSDGASPDDIKQGLVGNCWHVAALAVMSNIPGLIEQVCVKRNEEVGVYGFIFFRDGDWISTVVDDQLFYTVNPITNKTKLVFGSCHNPRETWLPLLEKAYAKVHGDYEALEGGWTGDGIEDLTGGVSNLIFTSDILNKDRFWKEEMLQVNKNLLMGCAINFTDGSMARTGLISGHAYSVLEAVEYKGERLVHLRNPWGEVEWNGDWSDDSDKWTPEAIETLNARNKDDGRFWMPYDDFLKIWTTIDRVRVFDDSWHASTTWMPYHVEPRSSGKFKLELTKQSRVVLAMCQPDTRYFGAQKQEFTYKLAFHVYDEKHKLVRRAKVTVPYSFRSVSCEVELEAGQYTIVPKIVREAEVVESDKDKTPDPTATEKTEAEKNYEALFAAKKKEIAEKMAKARAAGRALVGVDEVDEAESGESDDESDEEDEEELEDWELVLGLRVYSHDPAMTLEGIPGPHPVKKDESDEEGDAEGDKKKKKDADGKDKEGKDEDSKDKVDDPEEVTATRKDKKKKKKANKKKAKKAGKKEAESIVKEE
ncbi:hypothetical protein DFQ26_004343 [Actinomortierella ambigua]|nr:hypothetical protein DFQ26_004343 [Actinomortierella ambigua]